MTKHIRINVILAGAVMLAACNGANSVNTAQSTPATSAESTGAAPGSSGSSAAPSSAAAAGNAAPASGATAPAAAVPEFKAVSIAKGTRLSLELLTTVNSETSTVESPVRARLTKAVEIDGVVAMPVGTELKGVVTEAERAGRVKGLSRLAFRFNEAEVRGTTELLRTNPVVLVGEETKKQDAAKIGGGAVAGAVIGGILGGGKGAAEGAAIGGGAGTGVVLATRGKDVGLASGASVTATLADDLTIQIPR